MKVISLEVVRATQVAVNYISFVTKDIFRFDFSFCSLGFPFLENFFANLGSTLAVDRINFHSCLDDRAKA